MGSLFAPSQIDRLMLPEHARELGTGTRAAEAAIEAVAAPPGTLDVTGADTHRFPPPEWAIETFVEAASGKGATYTPARGDAGVREKLAASLGTAFGWQIDPAHELILTPGTQAALFIGIASLVESGDTVVLPDPDYMLTERICRFFNADVVRVPLGLSKSGEAVLDVARLDEVFARTKPRLFVFTNPNNPTGAVYDQRLVADIAEVADKHGVFVLADELYNRLVFDGRQATHIRDAIPGMADHVLTLVGPSKTESLSGFRVGAAAGPRALIDRMSDLLYSSAMRCPAYAQHLLARWISDDEEYVQKRIVEYQGLRDSAVERLNSMSGVSVESPGGTSYVFPEFHGIDVSDVELCSALRANGLIVSPGFQFGPNAQGHVRICFAQEESNLQRALDIVETTVRSIGSGS